MARTRVACSFVCVVLFVLVANFALAQSPVTDDAYVTGASSSTNFGTSTSLIVQAGSSPSYTYIRFNLGSIPVGAAPGAVTSSMVQKATMRLFVTGVTAAGNFDVYELGGNSTTQNWAETALTYSNQSAYTTVRTLAAGVNVAYPTPSSKNEYILIDVTQAVKDWLDSANGNGGQYNNGLVLKPSSGSSISASFSSKEDTTTSHDPELNIVWAPAASQIVGQISANQILPNSGTAQINISGNAASADKAGMLSGTPAPCPQNQYAVQITPSGAAICQSVPYAAVTGTVPAAALTGTYPISITGSAATATTANTAGSAATFTGNLAGDVTGTQSATVVSSNFARRDQGNTFAGASTFNGKVDASAAAATMPMRKITGAPPTGTNICASGEMVLQLDAPAGQQLFICNASLNGWTNANDETALQSTITANDKAYTDAQVAAEKSRAQGAESTLTANLANEVTRATGAESALTTNLSAEAATRASGDSALSTGIANEAATRQSADIMLQNNITGETTRATAAEATKADINKPVLAVASLDPNACTNAAVNAMVLLNGAPKGQQLYICRDNGDSTFTWANANDETALQSTLAASVTAETARAEAAESTLTTNLNGEISRATGAEQTLTTNLASESAARITGDATLQASIAGEVSRAQTAEADIAQSVTTETNRATAAEATLTDSVATKADKIVPVQVVTSVPAGVCTTEGAMVQVSGGDAGQQLYICRKDPMTSALAWTNANDETALQSTITANDKAYTDAQVAAEKTRAEGAESMVAANLASEVSRATGAEGNLSTAISNETVARQAADTAEAVARAAADASLGAAITGETARATGAEAALTASVNSEVTRAEAAEATKADINRPVLPVDALVSGACTNAAVNAMVLLNGAPKGQQLYICRDNGDSTFTWANANDETALQSTLAASVTAETARAEAAESTLTTNLGNEVSRATGAETTLAANLSNETVARQAADTAEAVARAAADASLSSAVTGETARATGAEAALTASVNSEVTRAEAAEATKADINKPILPVNALVPGDCTDANANRMVLLQGSQQVYVCRGNGDGTGTWVLANAIANSSVSNAQLQNNSITVNTGTGLIGGGTVALGGTLNLANAGVTSLTGSTNVNVSASTGAVTLSLPATLGVDISGNAASATTANTAAFATTAGSATSFTGPLAGDVTGTQSATVVSSIHGVAFGNFARTDQANTFTGQNILGSTSAASGGVLIPSSHTGSSRPSFPFDMQATNTGNNVHLFRIIAQDGGTPTWDFQFCAVSPCTPVDNGLSIAGQSGIITFASGQTFPGTQSSLTAGTGISINSNTVANTGVLSFNGTNGAVTGVNAVTAGTGITVGGTAANPTITNAGVTSLAGTANQITVSATTGGVTLSLPSTINVNAATATVAGSATTAGNVTGIVAVANGGTGVNSTSTAANQVFASPSGSAGAPDFRSLTAADLPGAQNTRTICYVAGGDNNSTALDTTYSQKSFFDNMIGNMTITAAKCQVDAGSVTMNVQKNNLASAVTTSVACTSGPGAWQTLTVSGSGLALGDSLDLSITAATTAKRLTVCVAGTVN